MRTEFWLFGQFESATLTVDQVLALVPVKVRTLRNWISDGSFPRPLPGDVFRLQDVAAWIDAALVDAVTATDAGAIPSGTPLEQLKAAAVAAAVPRMRPVVYVLMRDGSIVYVGRTINPIVRLHSHAREGTKRFDSYAILETPLDRQAALERMLILLLRPEYNATVTGADTP